MNENSCSNPSPNSRPTARESELSNLADAAASPCADLANPVAEADHRQGRADAPVALVEYGDYECPHCLNAEPIMRELMSQMGDRVVRVFRHFPQNSIHPHASVAAQAAEAAAAQGKFWEMHELLFRHQNDLGEVDYTHLALGIGLEVYRFASELSSGPILRRIREDFASGVRAGVQGTPTFFINNCRYDGSADLPSLLAAVDVALRSIPEKSDPRMNTDEHR